MIPTCMNGDISILYHLTCLQRGGGGGGGSTSRPVDSTGAGTALPAKASLTATASETI